MEWGRGRHTAAACWVLALTGVHIGPHWKKAGSGVRCMAHVMTGQGARRLAAHLPKAGLLFALNGVWASFERNMAPKLFLGASFGFWEPNWPAFLFFANHLAAMGAYAAGAMYAARFAGRALSPGKREAAPEAPRGGKKTKKRRGD